MTTATLMTVDEARTYRADYDAKAKQLDHMPRRRLPGASDPLFRGWSADELITRAMDGLGLTVKRYNEAIHVLHHQDAVWQSCRYCTGGES